MSPQRRLGCGAKYNSQTPFSTYGMIERRVKSGVFMWKFCCWGAKRFCHLHLVVWFFFSSQAVSQNESELPTQQQILPTGLAISLVFMLAWKWVSPTRPTLSLEQILLTDKNIKLNKCWACCCVGAYKCTDRTYCVCIIDLEAFTFSFLLVFPPSTSVLLISSLCSVTEFNQWQ